MASGGATRGIRASRSLTARLLPSADAVTISRDGGRIRSIMPRGAVPVGRPAGGFRARHCRVRRAGPLRCGISPTCRKPEVTGRRPSTVRAALQRAASVPWADLAEIGDRVVPSEMAGDDHVPDYATFELALDRQRDWLGEAARTGRGLVVVSH